VGKYFSQGIAEKEKTVNDDKKNNEFLYQRIQRTFPYR